MAQPREGQPAFGAALLCYGLGFRDGGRCPPCTSRGPGPGPISAAVPALVPGPVSPHTRGSDLPRAHTSR
eukprot:149667-Chlamydomonas_euryale.AAC.1